MSIENIFSGLKVVDLASFIAGPGAAVILSDFGADVIKVEPPAGDLWRIGHKIPPQPQSKDAKPAPDHNGQGDRIYPMRNAYDPVMSGFIQESSGG